MKKLIEKYARDPSNSLIADAMIVFAISMACWLGFNTNFSAIKTVSFVSALQGIGFGVAILSLFLVGINLSAMCKVQVYIKEFSNIDFNELEKLTNNVFKHAIFQKTYLAVGFVNLNFWIALATSIRSDESIFKMNHDYSVNSIIVTMILFSLMISSMYLKLKVDKLSCKNRQLILPDLKVQAKLRAEHKAKELAELREKEKHLPWYKKQF